MAMEERGDERRGDAFAGFREFCFDVGVRDLRWVGRGDGVQAIGEEECGTGGAGVLKLQVVPVVAAVGPWTVR